MEKKKVCTDRTDLCGSAAVLLTNPWPEEFRSPHFLTHFPTDKGQEQWAKHENQRVTTA